MEFGRLLVESDLSSSWRLKCWSWTSTKTLALPVVPQPNVLPSHVWSSFQRHILLLFSPLTFPSKIRRPSLTPTQKTERLFFLNSRFKNANLALRQQHNLSQKTEIGRRPPNQKSPYNWPQTMPTKEHEFFGETIKLLYIFESNNLLMERLELTQKMLVPFLFKLHSFFISQQ